MHDIVRLTDALFAGVAAWIFTFLMCVSFVSLLHLASQLFGKDDDQ